MDKDCVILVLLFFVCVLLAYVVDNLVHRKAEKNKERKAEIDRLLFINSIRLCRSRTEIIDILLSGITISVPNDTIAAELIDAAKRIKAEMRRKAEQTTKQKLADDKVVDIVKAKQHRNRPDLAKFGEENTEPGDNARFLRMARVSMSLPPIDISDAKQVEARINQYFDFCEQNDRKPNMIGMANWLGVDRATVNSWKTGEYRTQTHLPVIKKAVDILEELWVDYMMNGKVNPGSGIFIGKNLFQYKDVQDVVVTPNNPYETQSEEELSGKYLTGSVKAE